jgi:lipopolysaccharide exporter
MTIIGSAYAQVFFKNASEKYYKSELHDYSKSVANTLLKIIIPVSLVLGIFGKILFRIIFGNEWEMGGRYTQILTFYMLTAFIASPLSTILTVLGKQNIGLLFNFIVLILRILSLFVGRMTHNSYLAMFLFSLTGFFFNLFNIWFFLNVAKKSDMHIAEVNNDNNQ